MKETSIKCVNASQYIDEVESLLPAFELVLDNQKKLWDKIDDISGDAYKAVYPNFFGVQ